MIRLAFASVADTAIVPMQDILGLDSRARMNFPGKAEGNWAWRYRAGAARSANVRARLAELTAVYRRWNGTASPARPASVPTPPSSSGDGSRTEAADARRRARPVREAQRDGLRVNGRRPAVRRSGASPR